MKFCTYFITLSLAIKFNFVKSQIRAVSYTFPSMCSEKSIWHFNTHTHTIIYNNIDSAEFSLNRFRGTEANLVSYAAWTHLISTVEKTKNDQFLSASSFRNKFPFKFQTHAWNEYVISATAKLYCSRDINQFFIRYNLNKCLFENSQEFSGNGELLVLQCEYKSAICWIE